MAFDPSQFGATPATGGTPGGFDPSQFGATPVQPAVSSSQPKQSLADQIWSGLAGGVKAIGSVTGANAVGDSLGTAGFDAGQIVQGKNPFTNPAKVGGVTQPGLNPAANAHPLQEAGGIIQGGATVAGLGAAPATIGGAIGIGAGAGGLSSAGSALAGGADVGSALKQGAIGAAVGGGTAGAIAGAGKVLSMLPNRLVQSALPKLDPDNVDDVLNNTKLGTINGMLQDSKTAVSDGGSQIDDILHSAQYATNTGNGNQALTDAALAFPHSNYTADDVLGAAKQVVPGYAKTLDQINDGTATLADKNEVRSAIDMATKKIFTDSPQVSATKTLAASLASELRDEVKTTAPETQPVFDDLSKELNLRTALASVSKKLGTKSPINLYSIVSFLAGGLPAALGEEFVHSPATSIATAKAVNAVAPVVSKLASPLGTLAGGLTGQSSSKPNQ
jgi:hypothetical protein